MTPERALRTGRRGRAARSVAGTDGRNIDYRNLRSPIPPIAAFSDDRVEQLQASIRIRSAAGGAAPES